MLNGQTLDNSGSRVSAAGDFNGDGIGDLVIGARNANPNGNDSGRSYVVFGASSGLPNPLELSSLNGSNGFALNGEAAYDRSGYSVSGAGDINGDGLDDVIIGTFVFSDPGRSYVVFGASTGLPAVIELSSLNGSNGFALNGVAPNDIAGNAVSGAGDINGDGIDDLLIGARSASPNGVRTGASYVVFGASTGLPAALDLSSLNGSNGFAMSGAPNEETGIAVSDAGDINGDGIDDLIVGAWFATSNGVNTGRSYIVFGATSSLPSPLELSGLNGSNGFIVDGEAARNILGVAVSAAGDINGDGTDDLIIGAPGASPNGTYSGRCYVIFGASSGLPGAFALSSLNGSNGFVLNGEAAYDRAGISLSNAGDINGDGVDDVIIGSINADPNGDNSGRSYVIFGRAPLLQLSSTSLAFGNLSVGQTSPPQTVTVNNTGLVNLIIGDLSLSGANAADFGLTADSCSGQTVLPAANCSFDITFTPSEPGALVAQVDIPSNALSSPDNVALFGGAQALPVPALNPWSLGLLAMLLGWLGWRRRDQGIT